MMKTMIPPETTLRMFSEHVLDVKGMIKCELHDPRSNKSDIRIFYVVATHKQPVLGLQTCLDYGFIKVPPEFLHNLTEMNDSDNDHKVLTKDDILQKYSDLFVGYGKFEGKIHLDTDPTVEPV